MKHVVFNNAEIGQNLKELRANQHISINKLSKQTNINLDSLRLIESGVKVPTLEETVTLANFYNVPIDKFIIYDIL